MKRLLALAMSILLILSLSVGCVKLEEDENIIVVGEDRTVSTDMALVYLLSVKASAEQMGSITYIDGEPNEDYSNIDYAPIKEDTLEYIKTVVTTSYAASEKGLEITEEEIAAYKEEAATIYENFATMYADFIAEHEISQEVFEGVLLDHVMAEKLSTSISEEIEVADEDIVEDIEMYKSYDPKFSYLIENGVEDDLIRASHILLSIQDSTTGEYYTDEQKEEIKAKMQEILDRARAGEDFAELAMEYSEDPGSAENGGEYTFGRYDMVTEFDTAAFALEVGEISDIVETQYGYHIIKLSEKDIPVTEDVIAERTAYVDMIKDYAKQDYISIAVDEEFQKIIESYSFEVDEEAWENLSL